MDLKMFFLYLILIILHGTQSLSPLNNCRGNQHHGHWTCVDQNGFLNITFDCNLNNYTKIGLWLWSNKFPSNMKALTIKNCEKLHLDVSYLADHNLTDFYELHVLNIGILKLSDWYYSNGKDGKFVQSHKEFNASNSFEISDRSLASVPTDMEYELINLDPEPKPDKIRTLELPPQVTFKNIQSWEMENLWETEYSSDIIPSSLKILKSLKIINVTIDHLHRNFLEENEGLNELLIDTVNIKKLDSNAISLDNKQAVIKLVNSNMDLTLSHFLKAKVAKVIISGNIFKELSAGAFDCEADEFIFSDNKVGYIQPPLQVVQLRITENFFTHDIIPKHSLEVKSPMVNMHRNIFEYIASDALYGITAPPSDKTKPRRIFNFSKNEILAIETSTSLSGEEDPKKSFDSYNFFNNSIDCVCRNTPWFHRILEARTRGYGYSKEHPLSFAWINKKNPNKCLNIPNCTLNQVVYNIFGLCQEHYECPADVANSEDLNPNYNWMQMQSHYKDAVKVGMETADAIKKILQMEMEDRQGRESYFQNSSKIYMNQQQSRVQIADEKGITVPLLIIIALSINLILIMICLMVFKGNRSVNFPLMGRRLKKGHDFETEMHSRTSLVA